jgi:beta-glucoside operon transcriptional antiterminator
MKQRTNQIFLAHVFIKMKQLRKQKNILLYLCKRVIILLDCYLKWARQMFYYRECYYISKLNPVMSVVTVRYSCFYFVRRSLTMQIVKVINNNIVTSEQDGNEVVIMGKGVGFKKELGQSIDESQIEKIYVLDNPNATNRLKLLLQGIPFEEIQTVNEIISYAKLSLGTSLSDSIYLSLTDHLHFSLERYEKGLEFNNALSWEVKHFYHHEYLIGKEALEIVERRLKVKLPLAEAITIALHIVNAKMDNTMDHTVGMTKMIKQIISIIQYTFNREFSEESLSYERLLTHLKFFTQRIMLGRTLHDDNVELFSMIRHSYPKEYACTLKINEHVFEETGHKLTVAELAYLTIHINRILKEN